jgi:hypothetical protein
MVAKGFQKVNSKGLNIRVFPPFARIPAATLSVTTVALFA